MGRQSDRNAVNAVSILVDSSVWIDGFNPKIKTPEKEHLKQLIQDDYPIYLCPVIYQEVLQGIRDERAYEQIKSILQHYEMIHIDIMNVTEHAIDLYRLLRKKGITIRKSVDCLIASYAILANMALLHNDIDFSHIAQASKLKTVTI